jgi:hypothetical protein
MFNPSAFDLSKPANLIQDKWKPLGSTVNFQVLSYFHIILIRSDTSNIFYIRLHLICRFLNIHNPKNSLMRCL